MWIEHYAVWKWELASQRGRCDHTREEWCKDDLDVCAALGLRMGL